MQPNPVLRRLGYSDNDRVAIIHCDDVGMCLASANAFAELWEVGIISSGAVMMPCPWAVKTAEFARSNPAADLGVHVTLTSEWKYYRWGPVSTVDPQSGLIDEQGYFHPTARMAGEKADPHCVAMEIEAQVQRALAFGIQPTHLDTHMGAVGSFRLIPYYIKLAVAHRLPPMIFRMDAQMWQLRQKLDPQTAQMAVAFMTQLEALGLPLMDDLVTLHLDQPENRLEQAKAAFSGLRPGITHFYLHPSTDLPELREITIHKEWEGMPEKLRGTSDWRARVADYEILKSEELRRHLKNEGIQVIGYRALQSLMPDPALLQALPF